MFVSIYNGSVHKFSQGLYLTIFLQGFNFADGPEFSKHLCRYHCKIPTNNMSDLSHYFNLHVSLHFTFKHLK